MEVLRTVLLLLTIIALYNVAEGKGIPEGRLIGGTPADTIRRFPHHVTIYTTKFDGSTRQCSGSIIGKQWILSSIGCLIGGSEIRLDFRRLYLNQIRGTYSILVDNSTITFYPTQYDDLALIKIPLKLEFSSNVKEIALYKEGNYYDNQFVVMPGFGENNKQLTYGMFQIMPNQYCENIYGNNYDEYTQLCTTGWYNNKNAPCDGDQGGSLIVGWPKNPQLIGIFSNPIDCNSITPGIYMKVSRYVQWIRSVTGDLEEKPTTEGPPESTTPTATTTTTSTTEDTTIETAESTIIPTNTDPTSSESQSTSTESSMETTSEEIFT